MQPLINPPSLLGSRSGTGSGYLAVSFYPSKSAHQRSHVLYIIAVVLASYKLRDGIQLAYIRAILAQDAAYFDKHGSGEIAARGAKDMDIISKGYGEHLGWVMWFGGYLVGVSTGSVTGFTRWKRKRLTLI